MHQRRRVFVDGIAVSSESCGVPQDDKYSGQTGIYQTQLKILRTSVTDLTSTYAHTIDVRFNVEHTRGGIMTDARNNLRSFDILLFRIYPPL